LEKLKMEKGKVQLAIGRDKEKVIVGMRADISERPRLEALLAEARRMNKVYDVNETPSAHDAKSYVIMFKTDSTALASLTDELKRNISLLEKTIKQLGQAAQQQRSIPIETTVSAPPERTEVNYLGDWTPSDATLREPVRTEMAQIYGVLEQRGISPADVQSDSTKGELPFARAVIGQYLRIMHPGITHGVIGKIIRKKQVSVLLAARKFGDWRTSTGNYKDVAAFVEEARKNYQGR
jgi:hypothetical protein